MLYMGNNIDVGKLASIEKNGLPVKNTTVKQIEEEMKLFDEKKLITRQSIHYADLCADLSLEESPGLIDYITGTVKSGMERLTEFGVSQLNSGFLQNSVEGLATNFEEAAVRAKQRVQQKAELAQEQAAKQQRAAATVQQVPPPTPASTQNFHADVQQTLSNAIEHITTNIMEPVNPYNNAQQNINTPKPQLTEGTKLQTELTDKTVTESPTVDKKIDKIETPEITQTEIPEVKTTVVNTPTVNIAKK